MTSQWQKKGKPDWTRVVEWKKARRRAPYQAYQRRQRKDFGSNVSERTFQVGEYLAWKILINPKACAKIKWEGPVKENRPGNTYIIYSRTYEEIPCDDLSTRRTSEETGQSNPWLISQHHSRRKKCKKNQRRDRRERGLVSHERGLPRLRSVRPKKA